MGNKCDMLDELQVTEEEGRAKARTRGIRRRPKGSVGLSRFRVTYTTLSP